LIAADGRLPLEDAGKAPAAVRLSRARVIFGLGRRLSRARGIELCVLLLLHLLRLEIAFDQQPVL
jgi:hypothetical protein